ncbi:thioredoxin [Bacillus pumilus ATCC 7061]|nr:thioredoxin [Bacillus pumilus ATCC 7061]
MRSLTIKNYLSFLLKKVECFSVGGGVMTAEKLENSLKEILSS